MKAYVLRALHCMLLGAIGLVPPDVLMAQSDSSSHPARFWIEGGFGSSSTGGFSIEYALAVQAWPPLAFVARLQGGSGAPTDDFGNSFESIEVLVSVSTPWRYLVLSLSAGISHFTFKSWDVDGYFPLQYTAEQVERSTVGLPFDISLTLRPVRFFSVGARTFFISNSIEKVNGTSLFIQLGWMW